MQKQTESIKALVIELEKQNSIDITDEKEVINNIIFTMKTVVDTPEYNNAAVVTLFITYFFERFENLTLLDFENYLRFNKSRVYLLGLPLSYYEDKKKLKLMVLDKKMKKTKFACYVCMNGEDEFNKMLIENSITNSENRDNLKVTGFLMLNEKK